MVIVILFIFVVFGIVVYDFLIVWIWSGVYYFFDIDNEVVILCYKRVVVIWCVYVRVLGVIVVGMIVFSIFVIVVIEFFVVGFFILIQILLDMIQMMLVVLLFELIKILFEKYKIDGNVGIDQQVQDEWEEVKLDWKKDEIEVMEILDVNKFNFVFEMCKLYKFDDLNVSVSDCELIEWVEN